MVFIYIYKFALKQFGLVLSMKIEESFRSRKIYVSKFQFLLTSSHNMKKTLNGLAPIDFLPPRLPQTTRHWPNMYIYAYSCMYFSTSLV